MRCIITGLLLAVVVALGAPTAEAKSLKNTYSGLYYAVAKSHGKRVPGRNIRKQGVRTKHGTREASNRELARSIRTFRRWLAPPVSAVGAHDGPATAAPAYAGGRYAIPAGIVMCESGGDYGAYNPSSGAGGAYQILPSTWDAYGGTGSPQTASPAEQDRIAERVWKGQGRGAWVC